MVDVDNQPVSDMSPQMATAYNDAIQNIIFLKQQQWRITNYSLVAQAALVYTSKEIASPNWEAGLTVAVVFVLLLTIAALLSAQHAMTKFRKRLSYVYARYFTSDQRTEMPLRMDRTSFLTDPLVLFIHMVASTFGAILAIVLVYS